MSNINKLPGNNRSSIKVINTRMATLTAWEQDKRAKGQNHRENGYVKSGQTSCRAVPVRY